MITIARFSKIEEAYLLRLRLGAGDVDAFILDEYMIQMDWLISNAIGGVRVQIAEEDFERCKQILQEEPYDPDAAVITTCPYCQSEETERKEFTRRLSFLSMFIFGCPLPVAKNKFGCKICGESWNEGRRPSGDGGN